ncbi:hypothetical protein O3Q52_08840 [Streptomyces sp. ActVer]|uniref:hypothetical protein n=1 Tax=Streptomyces sp. ActVer TaxID=3014558 RepID=UPI0022B41C81|nr:hypothetical protein [Streptomyces sp. ActVer]MCZ4508307.1 hypothetical protein [Streptomyces sp. ActVer]
MTENTDYSEPKMAKFVDALIRATANERVNWNQVGTGPDSFQVSFPRNSAMVWSIDDDGQHPFRLALFDANGQTLESIETYRNSAEDQPPLFAKIGELYAAARKQVRNIDAILDGILEDLGDS